MHPNNKNSSVRVLLIVSHFPPEQGGVERYVDELYSRLVAREKWNVTVLTLSHQKAVTEEAYHGMRVIRVPILFEIKGVFSLPRYWQWKKAVRLISQTHYDFISTQTRFFLTSYLGMRLARNRKIALVHTEHGSDFVQSNSWLIRYGARIYDEIFGKPVLKAAQAVTCVSSDVAVFVKKWTGIDGVVVNNGVDALFWDPQYVATDNSKWTKNCSTRVPFLFIGRIIKAKGWEVLLDALYTLPQPIKDRVVCVIAGDGPEFKEMVRRSEELCLGGLLVLAGRLDRTEIRELLSFCCYINPSYSAEGLQTTLLEAAIMNSWIITTPASGVGELLSSDMGTIVAKQSVKELRDALISYLVHPHRATGSAHVAERYGWGKVCMEYKGVVESILH